MKFVCLTARPVLQQPSGGSTTSIWISDSLLAQTIQRFTCVHRRQGSSVPGPLEARKRSTRRRNTSLAPARPSGLPIDFGSLFGRDRKLDFGRVPNSGEPQPAAVDASPPLPSWLTGRSPPAPPSAPIRQQPTQGKYFWRQTLPATQDASDRFHDLLHTCDSLQEIKDLVQGLEVNLLQSPGRSRQILKHMLSSDWEIGEIHNFMIDATLHTPGSECLDELFGWLISDSRPEVHLQGFYLCVKNTLNLGLFTQREALGLLTKLSNIRKDVPGGSLRLGDTEDIQKWYWMIADAMSNCPIFGLKDLSMGHLQKWAVLVSEAPFAPRALDTLGMLQRHLTAPEWFRANVHAIQGLIGKWISYHQRSQHGQASSLQGMQQNLSCDCAKVADLLVSAQSDVAAESIRQLSEKLVRDVLKGQRQPTALEIWRQILTHRSIQSANLIGQKNRWKWHFDEASTTTGLSPRQAIVVRLWTASQLEATKVPLAQQSLASGEVTRHLTRLFERQLGPEQDLLAELVFTFQSLPLPSPSAALQKIIRSSTAFSQFQGSIDKLQQDLLGVSASRIALFKEDSIYKNARINLVNFVSDLAARTNANPGAFLQIAHALIMRDKLSVKIVTRILENNLPCKLSLARASSSTQLPSSEPGTITLPTAQPTSALTPAVALHLLNSLACSFALSPALSPRQSFRKVYWVYLYVHRYAGEAAIGREITRPLWHAGVTRYKETGTSPEKVNWILGKVREAEGNEIADRLLWFGAGGVKGWEEWMEGVGGGMDVKGWKRVVRKKIGSDGGEQRRQRQQQLKPRHDLELPQELKENLNKIPL